MHEVTCPQCRTRQQIDPDAEGYRCIVCAASWSFVRCTVCGERFHTRPKTRAWTCPACGTPHGRRRGVSRAGVPVGLLIGALLAVGAIVAIAQAFGDDDGADGVPPVPTSPTAVADPLDDVCNVISEMQVFRVDALGRAADALAQDAARLRELQEEESAAAVDEVVDAIHVFQDVARGGGDTEAATTQLLDALAAIDWC